MSRYEIAVRSGTPTAGSGIFDIRTTSAKPVTVLEIGAFTTLAGAGTSQMAVGFGRPATIGTASTSSTFQAAKSGDAASVTVMGSAWSAAPTAPTNFMRRFVFANNTGAGFIFQWPPGALTIPVSSSLILWSIAVPATTVPQFDVYAVIDEI